MSGIVICQVGGFSSLFPWLASIATLFLLVILLWRLRPREEYDLLGTVPMSQTPVKKTTDLKSGRIQDVIHEVSPIAQSAESEINGPVPATQYCPEERIVFPPPLVVVYDNSASMAFPLNMPENELRFAVPKTFDHR